MNKQTDAKKLLAHSNDSKSSFTTRLILGIVSLTLLGVVIIFLIVNTVVRGIIFDNAIGIAQREQALYASQIDGWFGTVNQTFGNLVTVVNAMETEQCYENIVESFVEEYGFIGNIFIGYENGHQVNGLRFVPGEGWILHERDWYVAAKADGEGEVAVSGAFWSQSGQEAVITASTFLPNLSGIGAVIAFSITFDYILEMVSQFPVVGEGYLILIGEGGQLIAHPEPHYALGPDTLDYTLRELQGGDFIMDNIANGVYIEQFDDERVGYSYFIATPLEGINWVLISIIPTSAIEAQVGPHLNLIMVSLVVFWVVLFALTVFFVSRLAEREQNNIRQIRLLERQRLEAVEESNRAKSRFLAKMSHEIRTPITSVLGISEIELRNKNTSPRAKDSFSRIYSSARVLLGIVNDILDLSKIEAGKMELVCEEYNMESMIGDIANLHLLYSDNKDVEFQLHVGENLPDILVGDILRIRQIMNNLLSNAFKYTEAGLIKLSIEWHNPNLVFCIHDTGLGMTSEQVNMLRTEYIRFHEQDKRHIAGTGLGMSIVYSLVHMMDGRIELSSDVGIGTNVIVTIPQQTDRRNLIRNPQRFELENRSLNEIPEFVPEPMPYGSVLIVDDMESNLYVLEGMLMPYEVCVETCSSGQAAIDKIKQGKEYDIVFMDQMMRGLDGTETMNIMRELGYTRPIVASTADAIEGTEEELLEKGFDDYISKPFDIFLLNEIMVKYIAMRS